MAKQGNPRKQESSEVADMALCLMEKVKEIKRDNPKVSRRIDVLEAQIRDTLREIRGLIDHLPEHDRDLVTVLVIHGLHRTADEVLPTS